MKDGKKEWRLNKSELRALNRILADPENREELMKEIQDYTGIDYRDRELPDYLNITLPHKEFKDGKKR